MSITMALQIVNEDGLGAEVHSLADLLLHLRKQNGKNVWIKDTTVYIKSYLDAREISSACVLSMLAISEQHALEEHMAIIDTDPNQQRNVAEVTARIFSLPDSTYEKVILFSSNPHSASIVSYISSKEIQQMLLSNASREHCFHRCILDSEQSAALFDHDSPVHLTLDRCSVDVSTMANTLFRNKRARSLGKLTLINGSHNTEEEDRSMESFWAALTTSCGDYCLFDEVLLKGFSFRSMDLFYLTGANVRSLGLVDDCQLEESACQLFVAAVEKNTLHAKSLKLYRSQHEHDSNHWSHRFIRAIGHGNCTLEEFHLRGHEDDDYMKVDSTMIDLLKRNVHLQHIHLSASPMQVSKETWSGFLESLSCHRSLKKVTLRPPPELVPAGWRDELETALFRKNQGIVLKINAQHASDRADMARCWQEECDDARLGGICRILDHRTRSFVLTFALEHHSNTHGLVFLMLRRNQDLLACC